MNWQTVLGWFSVGVIVSLYIEWMYCRWLRDSFAREAMAFYLNMPFDNIAEEHKIASETIGGFIGRRAYIAADIMMKARNA